ncbi:hypothetical protein HC251_11070 [Iamia sp. SCSIO 61187]|uniref:hypothetical protein n=1 Tax=Iamia sp. SCSIO 61187 TaxID=2722752 RepID=UPI001C62C998|nr:hypothetical protein [Iamia sp. SCSIO 61187]QYG92916.1 hypothetical protein HC251_11070 [Iamia sp. SCSIO 61187]
MTYSDIVMWLWVAALLGTLVAFACAWRAITRADLAVARVRTGATTTAHAVTTAHAELEGATRAAAGERVRLHTRVAELSPEA